MLILLLDVDPAASSALSRIMSGLVTQKFI